MGDMHNSHVFAGAAVHALTANCVVTCACRDAEAEAEAAAAAMEESDDEDLHEPGNVEDLLR